LERRDKSPPAGVSQRERSIRTADKTIGTKSAVREKRAVWIVHGMGQQIPFETLDGLTNGLMDALPQSAH